MSFSKTLKKESEQKACEYAKEFAEEIKPKLIDSAKKGYTGYTIDLENRDDIHILKSTSFINELKLLLDGCNVEIKKAEYKNTLINYKFTKEKLNITWR